MPETERTMTAAERFVRRMFDDVSSREADLCVLALERALIRGDHPMRVSESNEREHVEIPASTLVSPDADVVNAIVQDWIDVRHVADWIVSSCMDSAPWLSRLDAEGRPVKLTKIGSLERAVREADKAMLRKAASMGSATIADGDEAVHADLDDGWTLVRLLTPAALDVESKWMQHCIGQGAYDVRVNDPDFLFLSLRDPKGRPHATMEMVLPNGETRFVVWQLQGKQNERPIERHLRRIRPWLRENARIHDVAGELEWWSRYARARDDVVVDLLDPAPSVDLLDDVEFVLEEGDVLPADRLASRANVLVRIAPGRQSPVVLPRRLDVEGRIVLKGEGTYVFGESVRAGVFEARDCRLEGFPADFRANTTTCVAADVGTIPASAKTGKLSLPSSHAVLSEGFATTQLDLSGSEVDTLPTGLSAEVLVLSGCPVGEIPDGTRVGKLTVVGAELKRMGRIEGLSELYLLDVAPELEMPSAMSVAGDIRIVGRSFPSELPRRLSVLSRLILEKTAGIRLPEELSTGSLHVRHSCFSKIPDGARIHGLLLLDDAGPVDVGHDCSIGSIEIVRSPKGIPGLRMAGKLTVEFDPAIARIAEDGALELRDAGPSM